MHHIWHNACTETALITLQIQWRAICCICQGIRMLEWREIYEHLNARLYGKFHGWKHIAVCRYNDCNIAVATVCIIDYLCCNANIRFLFLKGMDYVSTLEASDFLVEVFAKYKLKIRIFGIRLKESVLISALINIGWTCREILDTYKFLIWLQKLGEQLHNINPIVFLPLPTTAKTIVEVEAVHINNNTLFFHSTKNKPTSGGRALVFSTQGGYDVQRYKLFLN